MDKYSELLSRVEKIEERNKKVEIEKAWETSGIRKITIAVVTYFSLAFYFGYFLGVNPWINATVPTVGYLLSTWSVAVIKKMWMRRRR